MYYYISLVISIIIFIIIQINEYRNSKVNKKKYTFLNLNNLVLLFFIYILSTIIIFLIYNNQSDITNKIKYNSINEKNIVNTDLLKKIPDTIYTGFTPYIDDDIIQTNE
tara:strand:+ start:330 stop:656 length:327 start_codon:yes stop_codon:yes gene_type:complete